jgi:hypothetical protein
MNLVSFSKQAFSQGGGSLNLFSGEVNPTSGYMVSTEGNEVKIQINPRLKEDIQIYELTKQVFAYIADKIDSWHEEKYLYLGLWYNSKDGLWYFDLSEWVPTFAVAVKLGIQREQKAIWDCYEAVEHKLEASKKFKVSIKVVVSKKVDINDASRTHIEVLEEFHEPVYASSGANAITHCKLMLKGAEIWTASAIEIE